MWNKLSLFWKILTLIGAFCVGASTIIGTIYAVRSYHFPPNPPSQTTAQPAISDKSTTLSDKNPEKRYSNNFVNHKKSPTPVVYERVFKPQTSHIQQNSKSQQTTPPINAKNSNVQIGPVSGDVIQTVNINELPEPEISYYPIRKNIPENKAFKTEYQLIVKSKAPLQNLYIEAQAPSIVDFEAACRHAMMHGRSPRGKGFVGDNIQNVSGDCTLHVITSSPDEVKIGWRYSK